MGASHGMVRAAICVLSPGSWPFTTLLPGLSMAANGVPTHKNTHVVVPYMHFIKSALCAKR